MIGSRLGHGHSIVSGGVMADRGVPEVPQVRVAGAARVKGTLCCSTGGQAQRWHHVGGWGAGDF